MFDPEKGLAMAISKKALGNTRDYFEVIKKWTTKYHKENPPKKRQDLTIQEVVDSMTDIQKKVLFELVANAAQIFNQRSKNACVYS